MRTTPHIARFSLKQPTNANDTVNYNRNVEKKIKMTFYVEQLFLLLDKLDETERQIVPSNMLRLSLFLSLFSHLSLSLSLSLCPSLFLSHFFTCSMRSFGIFDLPIEDIFSRICKAAYTRSRTILCVCLNYWNRRCVKYINLFASTGDLVRTDTSIRHHRNHISTSGV